MAGNKFWMKAAKDDKGAAGKAKVGKEAKREVPEETFKRFAKRKAKRKASR